MTEDQKYQGALYKDKNKKQKTSNNNSQQQKSDTSNTMAQHAYVEDVEETWKDYQGQTEDEKSPADFPPEAPTPPAAVEDDNVNVFDFLVATGQTPNASNVNLVREQPQKELEASESTSLVRYEYTEEFLDPTSLVEETQPAVQYGAGSYETPAPIKTERKKKDGEKTDKKRKRLHLEVPRDEVMTDAPPVLHSGLTGGLKGLMKFPPSPGDSGADAPDPSPASPLKKTKHSKHSKHHGQISNSIFGMMTGTSSHKKSKKRKTSSAKKSSSHHHREKSPKLIEYRPGSKDAKDGEGQMIVFKPRADVFFNFVDKGPDSERGCSMNKALKRFHRERQAAGTDMSKHMEEKELWRSIRLRRNEQGEIVLFSV